MELVERRGEWWGGAFSSGVNKTDFSRQEMHTLKTRRCLAPENNRTGGTPLYFRSPSKGVVLSATAGQPEIG